MRLQIREVTDNQSHCVAVLGCVHLPQPKTSKAQCVSAKTEKLQFRGASLMGKCTSSLRIAVN